jgi:hypothetical protein
MKRAQALVALAWMMALGVAWFLGWDARLAPLHAQGARVAIVALMALAAWAVGDAAARALGLDEQEACDAPLAARVLLGLGALGMLWLALGLAQAWRPWLAWTILAAGACAGGVRAAGAAARRTGGPARETLPRALVLPVVLAVIGVIVVGPMAFTPPVSSDELIYHLTLPKWWTEAGGLTALPRFSHSGFPMLVEMLYGWALLLREPVVAKLVHVLFGACAVALAVGAARREAGMVAGACAAAALLTTPVFLLNACWAWNDVATSAFVLAGTLLLLRAVGSAALRPAVAAGVAWGFAFGAKYTALPYFALAAMVAVAWPLPADAPARIGSRLRAVAVAGLVALALMSPWLVRNAVVHGNPIHPLADATLGRGRLVGLELLYDDAGAREGVVAHLRGLLDYHLFNTRADDTTGFLWLLALPFLALVPLPARSRRLALVGGGALILLSVGTSGTVRAQIPALVLLAVPVGAWLSAWLEGGGTRTGVARVLLLGAAVANLAILAWHDRELFDPSSVALGHEPEDAYLARVDPAHAVLRHVDDLAREDASVRVMALGVDRLFWLDAPVEASGPLDVPVLRDWAREAGNGEALAKRLRAEGITHLLFGREAFARALQRESVRAAWTDRDLVILRELLENVALKDVRAGGVELYRLP